VTRTAASRAWLDGREIASAPGRELILRAARAYPMLPGLEPVADAAVTVAGGVIRRVEPFGELGHCHGATVADLGEVTLCPGLINAHGHLELAHLGALAGERPRGRGFPAWVRWLLAQPLVSQDEAPILNALASMAATGTTAVADVCTRNPAPVAAACRQADMPAILFHEFFGCWDAPAGVQPWPQAEPGPSGPDDLVRRARAGHALYSTNPDTLRLAKAWDEARGLPFTIHLAEHEGEAELLATGRGEFAALMAQRVLPKDFSPPGLSPVAYAAKLGLLGPDTLAVHCVHVDARERELLLASNTAVCLCPRSNRLIGVGAPPAQDYLDAGLRLCLGTDSLASNDDLDLWNEARALTRLTPRPPALGRLLAAMTITPAQALGLDARLGSLAPGRLARLATVPADIG
jgi:aminodeoxyfutalosine deaminase